MNIFVLSPHRDDAAFSVSISIAVWLKTGHKVTVLNCFTRSLYAPYSDAETTHQNDRLSYVSAMRRREDEDFQKQLKGLRFSDLNLKDAPIRLRCSSDDTRHVPFSVDDFALPKIQKALAQALKDPTADALVLPLTVGHHVDHIVAREAALQVAGGFPLAFYEDLPYATYKGFDQQRETLLAELAGRGQDLAPHILRTENAVPLKRRAVLCYNSQIAKDTAEEIITFAARYDGGERLWANRAWANIAQTHRLSPAEAPTSGQVGEPLL